MKILRVIPSMNPKYGGPCQGIRNSIYQLARLGVENEVLCFDTPDADYLGMDDFVIHTIGPAKGGSYFYCSALTPWLMNHFADFDTIIIDGLWLHASYGTYNAWRKYKQHHKQAPRLFIMPHGMLDPYFQKAKDRRLKAMRNYILWKLREKKAVNNATGILFTCQEELLLARQTFTPYHPHRELNVGYGIVVPPAFTPAMQQAFAEKCHGWNKKPFLLFLSRIHPKKGVDLLIEAYLKLKSKDESIPQLIIAGPGLETSYGKVIKQQASVDQDILFTGMLTGDAKWGAFYCSQAFILPSHQENFGIAIVEAMASCKAVLITDKVNIWREIQTENAGIIDTDNQQGITNILQKWLSLPEAEKGQMGQNAYTAYRKHFSVEEVAEKMMKMINDV